ncbi:extracellular solute-binding protein [Blautia pseudococcoides]|uniref:extracellular solute-binding protein n=1 Tax=Blautia pseudococcoides TaxID=1796616 RepID=UPI00148B2674|nr:extracellular solute-binding protein [Blautia pseudococcoides]QJU16701.1 extracellular solute-binding protein [Blautia pseudococcoides]
MKKVNKWKRLAALGVSAMMIFSTVACGSDSKEGPKTDDGDAKKSTKGTTISFWNSFTGSDGDMLVELVNRYNEENKDGITVEMDISSDFDSQLSTAFAAGTGPTMILSSSAYRFTYGDYMQDIGDVFDKTNLNKDDFIQSYLDYCSEGDKLYFVPFQVVGYYMYWNKDLFQAAGLNPETPPSTWEEWQLYAEKITDEGKNIYGSGISYDYPYQIAHMMQRLGGLAVKDDNGSWKADFAGNTGYTDFLTMYKTLIDNGDNPLEADTDSMVSAGQIGMTVGGPWVTAGLDTAGVNYGIGLIPQGDAGDMNSVEVLGFSVTTTASDEEKEAAYKFIEWWNSENTEGSSPALEWSVANGFPAYTYSVQEKEEYKQSEKLSVMSSANPDAPTDFIVDSSFPGINDILNDVIPEMINSVAFGNASVEDAQEKAQNTADKIVEEYNK